MAQQQSTPSIADLLGMTALSLYAILILTGPLLTAWLPGQIPDNTTLLFTVISTAVVGTLILVTIFRRSLLAGIQTLTANDSSPWTELLLYAITYIPVVILTGLLVASLNNIVGLPPRWRLTLHHLLATGGTVTLLYLRWRGAINYPSWLRPATWTTRDVVALFGGSFFLTYASLNALFGPTGVFLVSISLLFATVLVGLRLSGALTARPQDDVTDHNS